MTVARKPKPVKAPKAATGANLRQFLDARKVPTRVMGDVEQHLLTRPLDKSRSTLVLHPSEIIKDDWCMRMSWFLLNGHKPDDSKVKRNGMRLEVIFAEGHEIHAKWQAWFREMGRLYGVYESPRGLRHWGMGEDPRHAYKEVPLQYNPLRLQGHADGWLTGFGNDLLLEIKSIGTGTIRYGLPSILEDSLEKSFKNIKRPFPDHVRQANLYAEILYLMYEDGTLERKPPEEIVFVYECKANQEYKEFVIDTDREMLAGVMAKVRWLNENLDGKPIPCSNKPNSYCPQCKPFEEIA